MIEYCAVCGRHIIGRVEDPGATGTVTICWERHTVKVAEVRLRTGPTSQEPEPQQVSSETWLDRKPML